MDRLEERVGWGKGQTLAVCLGVLQGSHFCASFGEDLQVGGGGGGAGVPAEFAGDLLH